MNRIQRSAALATSLLFLAGSALASPTVFEGRALITDLKVEVTDLRPEDGVAAGFVLGKSTLTGSATWEANLLFTNFEQSFYEQEALTVSEVKTSQAIKDVFRGPDFKFGLPDDMASFARTGGDYGAKLTVQASALEVERFNSFGPSGKFQSSGQINTSSWRLKPGTEIRISGDIDLWIHGNLDPITRQAAGSAAYLSLSTEGDPSGVFVGPSVVRKNVFNDVTSQFDQGLNESFELVARNTGNADVIIHSELYLGTLLMVATAVPEPSTWVLMFSGLALAGVSARRLKLRT